MTIYGNIFPTENQQYRVLPVEHNWSSAFRTSFEYKTDIITSDNGREQRRCVRENPRRTFEYTAIYKDEQKFALDRFLDRSPRMLAIVPESNLTVRMSQPMPPEQNFMRYSGGMRDWMQVGQTVILMDKGRVETRVIDSFSDTMIFFTETSLAAFPLGTRLYVGQIGRIAAGPTTTRMTGVAGTLSISALVDPGSDTYVPGVDGAYYLGFREYLKQKINWGQPPQHTHQWVHEVIDYGYGRVSTITPQRFPAKISKINFWRHGWKETMQLIDFFGRHRGRNRDFFLPSYEGNIPYYAAASGTRAILIRGLDFAYTYKDSTVYKRIVIRKKDGTDIHCQVDYVEALPDTDTSVIWLTEELPDTPLAPDDTNGIWWVTVARFATDRLDIDWITDAVAQFAFSAQNLENPDV